MTTMTLSPVSASGERISTANALDAEYCPAIDLAKYERGAANQSAPLAARAVDLPDAANGIDCGPAMTEDDTVSVLEVLAEMQRIIDRHIEKTEGKQGEP